MPVFALFDLNNFYASTEQLFNPALRGRPVVVLSSNDGCVIARSAEAKKIGVPMGSAWFKLRDLAKQHRIVALSSNFALYADLSDRVVQVLRRFSPHLEVYSIDESFLLLDGISHIDLLEYGQGIRQAVLALTGLTGCVGIGPSKSLAKLANFSAKKSLSGRDGVCSFIGMPAGEMDDLFGSIEVAEVWGVGRKINARLVELGILSVKDLRDADPGLIRSQFGVVLERTVSELRGVSCLSLEECPPDKQQIISSRSFGDPVTDIEEVLDAVATYTSRSAEKLRKQSSVAASITVFLHTDYFRPNEPQYHPSMSVALPSPSADSRVLIRWAQGIGRKLYRRGYAFKKAGVMLSGISPASIGQEMLFGAPSSSDGKRSDGLMAVMDGINQKWGRGAIRLAAEHRVHTWQTRRERMSPRYTTAWDELPVVLAK